MRSPHGLFKPCGPRGRELVIRGRQGRGGPRAKPASSGLAPRGRRARSGGKGFLRDGGWVRNGRDRGGRAGGRAALAEGVLRVGRRGGPGPAGKEDDAGGGGGQAAGIDAF